MCLGGLVIATPTCAPHCAFAASEKVTAPIVAHILAKQQEIKYMCDQMTIKAEVRHVRQQHLEAVVEPQPKLSEHFQ